jgi:hypothetical protein
VLSVSYDISTSDTMIPAAQLVAMVAGGVNGEPSWDCPEEPGTSLGACQRKREVAVDGEQFDALVRDIADRPQRRALLRATVGGILSAGLVMLGRGSASAVPQRRTCPLDASYCRKNEYCQSDGVGSGYCQRCAEGEFLGKGEKVCTVAGSGDCCTQSEPYCCSDGSSSVCASAPLGDTTYTCTRVIR